MKLLADQHISPRTVDFLCGLGHDAIRVVDRLPSDASDREILEVARREGRVVLTQDLDFTGLIALREPAGPSLVILRLGSPGWSGSIRSCNWCCLRSRTSCIEGPS